MKNSIFMLLIALICSCQQMKEHSTESSESMMLAKASAASGTNNVQPIEDPASKLIKTADCRFRVKDMNRSMDAIERMITKYPAHIASSNITSEGKIIQTVMTIRVESMYFNTLLKDIDKEAMVIHYRNLKTEDVGKQFVDLQSRLQTKREVQERFKEILRKKAGTIEELLSAERQIGELQEEIEATISRLNYLKDQVAMSTINLDFYQQLETEVIAADDDSILQKMGGAISSGFNGLVSVLISVLTIWPLLVFFLAAYLILRKKMRTRIAFPEKTSSL